MFIIALINDGKWKMIFNCRIDVKQITINLIGIFFSIFFLSQICLSIQFNPVRVQNSIEEIKRSQNKIKIELIRIWCNDQETDEKKILFEPQDILIDPENNYYILTSNEIRVFNKKTDYLRNIGRSGLGPGEFLRANQIEFDRNNNILVSDEGNWRLQYFSTLGKYEEGFKLVEYPIGPLWINKKNEIVMLNRSLTTNKSPLWLFLGKKGNLSHVRGIREANSINYMTQYKYDIAFYADNSDSLFSAYRYIPVIEKHNNIGELKMEIRYEVPFKVPELTSYRDYGQYLINSEMVCQSIAGDSRGNIFVLGLKRERREQEYLIGGIISNSGGSFRVSPKIDKDSSDLYQILVINPKGKIVNIVPLNKYVNKIRIFNNVLFLIDSFIDMTISEYKIIY